MASQDAGDFSCPGAIRRAPTDGKSEQIGFLQDFSAPSGSRVSLSIECLLNM
jgi:hypothetical protein